MKTKKFNVILCTQAHLPSGTSEAGFEALYNSEIKPLVQALNKFPRITMVFHYSGVILNWIERRYPELFMLLEDILARKQAEFLGGGFYEPALPLLPLADKIGQIEMLTTYLRRQFGKRPQGCWIPAMAWEQNMVGPLNSCGMNYTFLEDSQFLSAGVTPNEGGLFFPCVTEDQGKLITVFPLARAAGRELRNGTKTLDDIAAALPLNSDQLIVLAMEPQNTGNPPPDYEMIFEKLSKTDSGIEFTTPAKIFKSLRRLKKVYFSGVCAAEHNAGPIPPRQFLAEYPEAGLIYAKTIHVHTLINNKLRGDKTRKRTALEELWKAQDSGIFRQGSAVSPGLFHSPVRKAAYGSLLEAEKITREKVKFTPSLSFFDFDLDGEGEYIFQDDKLNCCIKSTGAGIFELDYLPGRWNYLDTLAPEAGARRSGGERRRAFVDWLAPAGTPPDAAGFAGIPEGRFCGAEEYEVSEIDRVRRQLCFRLPAKPDFPFGTVEIEKCWQLKKNSLVLDYVLKNSGTETCDFVFCPSADLSFAGEGEANVRILAQRDGGKETTFFAEALTLNEIKLLEFQDIKNEAVITLESSRNCNARIFNVRAGFAGREEYQSTCIMPFFPVSLEGGKSWKLTFSLKITS